MVTFQHSFLQMLRKFPSARLVVGVSGGVDSVALAHFLHARGYPLVIAHLNHGVRGKAADADQKFVEMWAKKHDILCISEKVKIPTRGNFEDNARTVRYAFLERVRMQVGAQWIAVAHHADDQVETILLHLLRGCDLAGARGMKAFQGQVVRPFLDVSREDILAYARQNKLLYREDATNSDLRYRRNFFRHFVIPELKKEWPTVTRDILKFADGARHQDETVTRKAREWIQQQVLRDSFDRREFLKLDEHQQRVVLKILGGGRDVYRPHLVAIQELIRKGVTGKRLDLKKTRFEVGYGVICVERDLSHPEGADDHPRLRDGMMPTRLNSGKSIVWHGWKIHLKTESALLEIIVRSWQPGDRFRPAGMQGTKKVQDFFTDAKIPRHKRSEMPIVTDADGFILAIGTLRLSQQGKKYQLDGVLEMGRG